MRRNVKRVLFCILLILVLLGSALFAILFNVLAIPGSRHVDDFALHEYTSHPATDAHEPVLNTAQLPAALVGRAARKRAIPFGTAGPLVATQTELSRDGDGTEAAGREMMDQASLPRGTILKRRAANDTSEVVREQARELRNKHGECFIRVTRFSGGPGWDSREGPSCQPLGDAAKAALTDAGIPLAPSTRETSEEAAAGKARVRQ